MEKPATLLMRGKVSAKGKRNTLSVELNADLMQDVTVMELENAKIDLIDGLTRKVLLFENDKTLDKKAIKKHIEAIDIVLSLYK